MNNWALRTLDHMSKSIGNHRALRTIHHMSKSIGNHRALRTNEISEQ
jgi:hypothetical protein